MNVDELESRVAELRPGLLDQEMLELAQRVDDWSYMGGRARMIGPAYMKNYVKEAVCQGSVDSVSVEINLSCRYFFSIYELRILSQEGQEIDSLRSDLTDNHEIKKSLKRLYLEAERRGKTRIETERKRRKAERETELERKRAEGVAYVRSLIADK